MTKKTATFSATADYRVSLARFVRYGVFRYPPSQVHVMKGSLIKAIIEQEGADVIAAADRL